MDDLAGIVKRGTTENLFAIEPDPEPVADEVAQHRCSFQHELVVAYEPR
jgi:hypothetical protein